MFHGPDGISNQMLFHLPLKGKKFILSMCNYTNCLERETGCPSFETHKDCSLVTSYGLISLARFVCKTMEHMVNCHRVWVLETFFPMLIVDFIAIDLLVNTGRSVT
jgi:hypothetical protein